MFNEDPLIAASGRIDQSRLDGRLIIDMTKGELPHGPSAVIRAAAIRAARDDPARYTAIEGSIEFREAVAAKLERVNRLHFDADEIIACCGANQALDHAIRILIQPGDEAVLIAPFWPLLKTKLDAAHARVVIIETDVEGRYRVSPDALRRSLNKNSRLLFINNPCNPTGQAYSAAELAGLAAVLQDFPNVVVVSDDVYDMSQFDGAPLNILNVCPELKERVIIVNSLSKAHALSGWRIGYAASGRTLRRQMLAAQTISTFGPSSLSQHVGVVALNEGDEAVRQSRLALKQRHDRLLAAISDMPECHAIPSDGSFYTFVGINHQGGLQPCDDVGIASRLLAQEGLAVAPGSHFGAPGHLRLSYALDDVSLNDAIERLANFFHVGEPLWIIGGGRSGEGPENMPQAAPVVRPSASEGRIQPVIPRRLA